MHHIDDNWTRHDEVSAVVMTMGKYWVRTGLFAREVLGLAPRQPFCFDFRSLNACEILNFCDFCVFEH